MGSICLRCADRARRRHWINQANGRPATLYFLCLFNDTEEFYKVGITYHSVKHRYSGGKTASYSYEILAQHTSTNATAIYDWEQSILETFAHLRGYPKTPIPGQTECFSSAEEILEIFPL